MHAVHSCNLLILFTLLTQQSLSVQSLNSQRHIVIDDQPAFEILLKDSQDGSVNIGSAVPDWSDVYLDGHIRYLEALLVVDADVARIYGFDEVKIRKNVIKLIEGVNNYLYQIDLRMTIVDILRIDKSNMDLDAFLAYRNQHIGTWPEHDFAILISYRYMGGIAYVDGICGSSNVGISGFFPESPADYAGVFFHELAHLLGMPHDGTVDCHCSSKAIAASDGQCLKIDGYERNCSVQALVNMLPRHRCIERLSKTMAATTVPVCGNGIRELDEQCDCGPERYCHGRDAWNCRPIECTQKITDFWQYVILITFAIVALSTISFVVYNTYCRPLVTKTYYWQQKRDISTSRSKVEPNRGHLNRTLASVPIDTIIANDIYHKDKPTPMIPPRPVVLLNTTLSPPSISQSTNLQRDYDQVPIESKIANKSSMVPPLPSRPLPTIPTLFQPKSNEKQQHIICAPKNANNPINSQLPPPPPAKHMKPKTATLSKSLADITNGCAIEMETSLGNGTNNINGNEDEVIYDVPPTSDHRTLIKNKVKSPLESSQMISVAKTKSVSNLINMFENQ